MVGFLLVLAVSRALLVSWPICEDFLHCTVLTGEHPDATSQCHRTRDACVRISAIEIRLCCRRRRRVNVTRVSFSTTSHTGDCTRKPAFAGDARRVRFDCLQLGSHCFQYMPHIFHFSFLIFFFTLLFFTKMKISYDYVKAKISTVKSEILIYKFAKYKIPCKNIDHINVYQISSLFFR